MKRRKINQLFVCMIVLAALVLLQNISYAATFTVTNTDNIGPGSLRQAIADANDNAGTDTITFNISGTGPHSIRPSFALPSITDTVVIDGYTQVGSTPNTLRDSDNAILMVEINGSSSIPGQPGLRIEANDCIIKGLAINQFRYGVDINGHGNTIQGNFIGTDITGTVDAGNTHGIFIDRSSRNTIGGTAPEARNIISSNNWSGVYIFQTGAVENVVQGNFIGTDKTGTVALGNGSTINIEFKMGAVTIELTHNNTIGGNMPGARNIISGNKWHGILNWASSENVMQGNWIGLAADGSPLGNELNGIIFDEAYYLAGNETSLIGGTSVHAPNVIAYNGLAGILIEQSRFAYNYVNMSSNSLFDNGELGIDSSAVFCGPFERQVCSDGITAQDFPVIEEILLTPEGTTVNGTLNSEPDTLYRIEFYANAECDPSGHGEGEQFLGADNVTTDTDGDTSFSVMFPVVLSPDQFITSTVTGPDEVTSEFSECYLVNNAPVAVCSNVTVSADSSCTANASVDNGSYDPDGDPITLSQSPPGSYPLAENVVTLSVTDVNGASDMCIASVLVLDTTDPSVTCPGNQSVSATSPDGATVTYEATTSDNCPGVAVNCLPQAGSTFAIGTSPVACTASDGSGNTDTCVFIVHVKGADEQLSDLIGLVRSFSLARGIEVSFVRKLRAALEAISEGDINLACTKLSDLINEVGALTDIKISEDQAGDVISEAIRIKTVLNCP